MRVNIRPQWKRLANWFWDTYNGTTEGMSIWEMLEHEYGAYPINPNAGPGTIAVEFPDEKMYTLFLLRWS